MPYIITTYERGEVYGTPNAVKTKSRVAVATLEEAREKVSDLCKIPTEHPPRQILEAIDEKGGTIGPLPDGTIVEAVWVSWSALGYEHGNSANAETRREYIAAYNAAQETHA